MLLRPRPITRSIYTVTSTLCIVGIGFVVCIAYSCTQAVYIFDVICIHTYMYCLQAVYGVKGKCVFHLLSDFDVIENDPIDYMHCILLGVMRTLTSLWFDSKHHKEKW